jgi:hypothetical protein
MKQYVAYIPNTQLRCILKATTWAEVVSELYEHGYVNCGEIRVVEEYYELVSSTPQIIDTNYGTQKKL